MPEVIWRDGDRVRLRADGAELEGRCIGPAPQDAPTLILLHEGLGSVELWRNFPLELAERTGCGVFVYSRLGYGRSDPVALPRPLDYMTAEADNSLPELLDRIGLRQGVLLGHSDGASIAALYAGRHVDARIRGLILMAPHFFTEPVGLAAIAAARAAYDEDLRRRLSRYHDDVDGAFRGWNDAWLHPDFIRWNIESALPGIDVPVLAIQGDRDEYGTIRQLQAVEKGVCGRVQTSIIPDCRHSPHLDQPQTCLELITEFLNRVDMSAARGGGPHE